MKKTFIVVMLVAMFGWAVYDIVNNEDNTSGSTGEVTEQVNAVESEVSVGLNVGDQAPDFELETLQGESVKLSDYRGTRVMINFWATWCPPCRAEMPDMQQFYEDKDVEVLAINLTETEDAKQDVLGFVEEFGLTFTILQDKTLDTATSYEIQPIPTSFMVDSNGIIQFVAFGPLNYDMMVQEFEKMS